MKTLNYFIVIIIILLLCTISAQAQKPFTPRYQPPLPHAKKNYVYVGNKKINTKTGLLAAIYQVNYGPLQGSPEEMARNYLRKNKDLFGMKADLFDLVHNVTQKSPAGYHVRFYQVYQGIPVYNSDIVISISGKTNMVTMVMAEYDPTVAVPSITPILTKAEAIEKARFELKVTGYLLGSQRAELRIFPVNESYFLSYRVVIPTSDPMGDWEAFIDALTGDILWIHDMMVYTNGTGYVFDPDPLTTDQVYYGQNGYVDNNDADSPQLNGERISVTLQDITYQSDVYHLEGPYINLTDFESPWGEPVTESDPDSFTYTRNQQGFEDVMVYSQIDQNQRYLQNMGFNNIQNGAIEADPHGLNGQDNSHYIPSSNRLAFGEGGVDDAEDTDVIIHEYGHAIQHDQIPGTFGSELNAIGEGFGD